MREAQKHALEDELREKVLARIVVIQRWTRAKLLRCRFLHIRRCTVTIQVCMCACIHSTHVHAPSIFRCVQYVCMFKSRPSSLFSIKMEKRALRFVALLAFVVYIQMHTQFEEVPSLVRYMYVCVHAYIVCMYMYRRYSGVNVCILNSNMSCTLGD